LVAAGRAGFFAFLCGKHLVGIAVKSAVICVICGQFISTFAISVFCASPRSSFLVQFCFLLSPFQLFPNSHSVPVNSQALFRLAPRSTVGLTSFSILVPLKTPHEGHVLPAHPRRAAECPPYLSRFCPLSSALCPWSSVLRPYAVLAVFP
jgi:hypothetical protein